LSVPLSPDPPLRLLAKFQELNPNTAPAVVFQAPGRDMWIAARANDREIYSIRSLEYNRAAPATFSLHSAKMRNTVMQRPLPRWVRYPAGVILRLSAAGFDVPCLHAVICGDEPRGPRYEYGLGILFAALCHELNNCHYDSQTLTEVVDTVQREYLNDLM
jgi:galactokinase